MRWCLAYNAWMNWLKIYMNSVHLIPLFSLIKMNPLGIADVGKILNIFAVFMEMF